MVYSESKNLHIGEIIWGWAERKGTIVGEIALAMPQCLLLAQSLVKLLFKRGDYIAPKILQLLSYSQKQADEPEI